MKTTPRLATLDQLDRLIYARIFSKTLSVSLRVGLVACSRHTANELAYIKLPTSVITSPFTEAADLSDAGRRPLRKISFMLARATR